jgi:hypothetical protein
MPNHRIAAAAAAFALALPGAARTPGGERAPARVPVLVELFTSEGCSSCPPADAVLARLLRTQPLPGVEVIVLGEHVDYWDSSGWRDRFSSREATLRQSRYAEQFGSGRIYTPQAVVGGRLDVVGSDEAGLRTALLGLSSQAHGTVVLSKKVAVEDALAFHVDAAGLPAHGAADVMLAVVEDGLVSKVVGGENNGRTLEHAAVVRKLIRIGETAGVAWQGDQRIRVDSSWRKSALRLVAFVQDRDTGRVLAATSAGIAARD